MYSSGMELMKECRTGDFAINFFLPELWIIQFPLLLCQHAYTMLSLNATQCKIAI